MDYLSDQKGLLVFLDGAGTTADRRARSVGWGVAILRETPLAPGAAGQGANPYLAKGWFGNVLGP